MTDKPDHVARDHRERHGASDSISVARGFDRRWTLSGAASSYYFGAKEQLIKEAIRTAIAPLNELRLTAAPRYRVGERCLPALHRRCVAERNLDAGLIHIIESGQSFEKPFEF